jgi:uncharacterized repeat protein (TIGR01451 family)
LKTAKVLEVNKTVWDDEWSEYAVVNEGETVQFRVSIYNPFDDYSIDFSGVIFDQLPCHLTYVPESISIFYEILSEVIDVENNTVHWNKPYPIPPHSYLNFTYEAISNCDCDITIGSNNVTVSPTHLINESGGSPIFNNQHPDWQTHPEWWDSQNASLNVSDNATVEVICDTDQPGVSVVKYSADDCHDNWNDTDATDVHVSSYPKFRIDVENSGDVMLDTITVLDMLPVDFNFDEMLSGHDDPVVDGRELTWTFEDKDVDWSTSLVFTVSFDDESIVCQEYENEVVVTGEVSGYSDVYDDDSAWVNVYGCEQEPGEEILIIEKWVKPNCHDDLWDKSVSFDYGDYDYVTYRVDIHVNDSFTEPIFDLQIRDNLPQLNGLQYNESYVREVVDGNEEVPFYNYNVEITDDYIYWQFNEEIYPGSTFALYYCADVIACGTFENWANVTGFYYDGGPCCPVDVFVNDSAMVEVICGSGIDVTKEASLDGETWTTESVSSFLDDTIWFRLTVENIGFEILDGVNVYDYLPDFLGFNEMIDAGGADHVFTDCENETYDLRWFFTELVIGETVEIVFTADVTKIKNGTNVVTVSSCGGPGSSDDVDIFVDEGMFVEKTASINGEDWSENVTVSSGETVSWKVTINYLNSDTNCILHHLTIWDILAEDFTYVDDSAVISLHNATSYSMNPEIDDDVLIWDLDDEFLLNGDWIQVTFDTLVDSDAFGEIENMVNVTGRVCDGTYYEVTDTAIAYVSSGSLASCEKLVRRNSGDAWVDEIDATLDDEISFKITLTNTGFGAMNHINIEDDLPDELEYIQDSSELYFDGETVSCEPLLVDGTLVWEDICTCIPNEDSEQEARYLLVDETVSIIFDVRTISSGTAINQMNIDAKMCENSVQVSCSDDATVNIEVNPLVADSGNSYSGYVNEEIQLSGQASGGIPDYSYYWDLDDDGEFDDSTLQNPTETWTEAGSYTISLKVIDDSGSNDTDSTTVNIEDREPNLYCSGSITLTDIEPGSTQIATITVENTGDPGSKLDWSILSEPDWGDWTFSPSEGSDLTPEDGEQIIEITIIVPDEKNSEFTGSITIVNDDDSSDTCEISVSVATPYFNKHPFLSYIEQIIDRFPFLDWLFETILS